VPLESRHISGVKHGPYELREELGSGGMGRVVRAVHLPTGAPRIVKILTNDSDLGSAARRRSSLASRTQGSSPCTTAGSRGGLPGSPWTSCQTDRSAPAWRRPEERPPSMLWRDAAAISPLSRARSSTATSTREHTIVVGPTGPGTGGRQAGSSGDPI